MSITFDNSNKKQSPLGFETHDEITITRQVKCLIWMNLFKAAVCNPGCFKDPTSSLMFLTDSLHTAALNDFLLLSLQVVIGGRNKYLINGVNANNMRVQDLFCSVGLNVNNPHFLIMQVISTEVLVMKAKAADCFFSPSVNRCLSIFRAESPKS